MEGAIGSSATNVQVSAEYNANMAAIEPLLTLALGASEEVNTSAVSKCSIIINPNFLQRNGNAESFPKSVAVQGTGETLTNLPMHSLPMTVTAQQITTDGNQVQELNMERPTLVAISPDQLQYVQTEGLTGVAATGSTDSGEAAALQSYVVIEQAVLDQISGFLKNSTAGVINTVPCTSQEVSSNTVTTTMSSTPAQPEMPSTEGAFEQVVPPQEAVTAKDKDKQPEKGETIAPTKSSRAPPALDDDDDEWIDTKATALKLTEELRRYHIPQAVFAKKVLNRSQGTLSDLLRKPKPWNEMRLGKVIFKRMKEWLELPEVKRIPQLRMEAAKELDIKARRLPSEDSTDLVSPKKIRRQFTEAQKRSLMAIFKETKKPTKDMQKAVAEELGLELSSVANFFMNARRRHTDI